MAQPLRRPQERQLYEIIQSKGLVISEFSLGTTPSGRPSVAHVSGFYFAFLLEA